MVEYPMDKVVEALGRRVSILPPHKVAALEQSAVMEFDELVAAQNAQSRLFASSRIPMETAQWAYSAFGGEFASPRQFKEQSLAKRIVAVNLAAVLIKQSTNLR